MSKKKLAPKASAKASSHIPQGEVTPGLLYDHGNGSKGGALSKQIGGNHYKKLTIQPAVYSELNGLSFLEGTVVKYITRYKDKGGLQDLDKVKHCVDLLQALWYGDQSCLTETIERINRFIEEENKLN